jgi:putative DNA primase/helicase
MRRAKAPALADLIVEVERMATAHDWTDATPAHVVAWFARLYLVLYKIDASELADPRTLLKAIDAARIRIDRDLDGDVDLALEFVEWIVRSENAKQNKNPSDFMLTWRWLFTSPLSIERYRRYCMQQGNPLPLPASTEPINTREPSVASGVNPRSDLGNAYRLRFKHGDDLRHVSALGWLVWDGARFRQDDDGAADRRAQDIARDLFGEATEAMLANDRDGKDLLAFATKSSNRCGLESMLSVAASLEGIAASHASLDRDPWALNVNNGTIDLRTGELRDHDRNDNITKLAPVDFDPDAAAPLWLRCLDRWMGGNANVIAFLQRWVGYCLTGDVREQVLVFHHGEGQNGKSKFIGAVQSMMGDYSIQGANGLLIVKQNESHPTEIADLRGTRLAGCIETGEDHALAEVLVKQLTGGDRIRARRMHRDHFEFEPTHKLMIGANHKPRIRGTDFAIWRRIRLVPWLVQIPDDEKIGDLDKQLLTELPGIMAWAVQGCLEWQRVGLQAPKEVMAATEEYRTAEDTFARFLDDECVIDRTRRVSTKTLNGRMQAWAKEQGEPALTQRELGLRLTKAGFEQGRDRAGMHWRGLDVVTRTDERDVEQQSLDAMLDEMKPETRVN